jgi:hypothetical protein
VEEGGTMRDNKIISEYLARIFNALTMREAGEALEIILNQELETGFNRGYTEGCSAGFKIAEQQYAKIPKWEVITTTSGSTVDMSNASMVMIGNDLKWN